jgi:hypothetical protein
MEMWHIEPLLGNNSKISKYITNGSVKTAVSQWLSSDHVNTPTDFFLDVPIYLQSIETHSANGVL